MSLPDFAINPKNTNRLLAAKASGLALTVRQKDVEAVLER